MVPWRMQYRRACRAMYTTEGPGIYGRQKGRGKVSSQSEVTPLSYNPNVRRSRLNIIKATDNWRVESETRIHFPKEMFYPPLHAPFPSLGKVGCTYGYMLPACLALHTIPQCGYAAVRGSNTSIAATIDNSLFYSQARMPCTQAGR